MKFRKVFLLVTLVSIMGVLTFGCASDSNPTTAASQVATVQRGNLRVEITGVGNLALSEKVDLAFEMDGTVQEVIVQEAQSVTEGQEMARLDTSAWDEQVTALEDKVTTAERNVTTKERAVTQAQRNVTTAERNVTQAERGVTDAEQSITTKKRDLLQAQINLNNAQLSLEQTQETSTDPLEIQIKQLSVDLARGRLDDARRAVEDAETTGITDAHQAVEDARVRVQDALIAVDDARQAVVDAQKTLEDARDSLAEAREASPVVKAPFDGFITSVNVAGGDEVKKGTVAVTIANPSKFEADVMVSEKDIMKIRVGGTASVLVEAMQGVSFPAAITQVAPSATIQSGVVNYRVKVELTSLQPLTQTGLAAMGNVSSGTPSPRFGQGFSSGNLTPEQINQLMQQRQQARNQTGVQSPTGQTGSQQQISRETATTTGNTQLAEGMTVTVSIVTAESDNVLLVPVGAIISRGGQTLVQVLNNGATEDRPVQVGLSNYQYAEISSGLSEGEEVLVLQASSTTSGIQQQGPPGGAIQFGRILR